VRNATLRSNAKFIDTFMRLENIIMVKEPEAAALYVVRLKENESFLKVQIVSVSKFGTCF